MGFFTTLLEHRARGAENPGRRHGAPCSGRGTQWPGGAAIRFIELRGTAGGICGCGETVIFPDISIGMVSEEHVPFQVLKIPSGWGFPGSVCRR